MRRTGLLDTGPEEPFDRLARLAATLLGTPFAFVTLVDDRRSYWKSCIGVDATGPADRQITVEESFCQYVINSGSHVVVTDARTDARTHDNLSIASMGVTAWASAIHCRGEPGARNSNVEDASVGLGLGQQPHATLTIAPQRPAEPERVSPIGE